MKVRLFELHNKGKQYIAMLKHCKTLPAAKRFTHYQSFQSGLMNSKLPDPNLLHGLEVALVTPTVIHLLKNTFIDTWFTEL